jgi:hypothetical protein
MRNFSAAAVVAAYPKVLSDCGGNRVFHAIELKFSFFTSDRSNICHDEIKPFADTVNDEGDRDQNVFRRRDQRRASPAAGIGRRWHGRSGPHVRSDWQ